MGNLNAMGFAEAVNEGSIDLRSSLSWHLSANHYPPVPTTMIDPCLAAIAAIDEDEPARLIDLPDGVTFRGAPSAPAYEVADAHHLQAFCGLGRSICMHCGQEVTDGREDSGYTGEGADWMTPDGDFGCDDSPISDPEEGVGPHCVGTCRCEED